MGSLDYKIVNPEPGLRNPAWDCDPKSQLIRSESKYMSYSTQGNGSVIIYSANSYWDSMVLPELPLHCVHNTVTRMHIIPQLNHLIMPPVLWRCWLGGRKGIRTVKNWVVGCWCGYLSGAWCWLAYGPADANATHCLLLQKIQIGFTFLVLADPGSPGLRAVKRLCVFV